MKIIKYSVLKGANIFSYRPVLWLQVSLEDYADTPSSQIKGFVEGLLKALPSLQEHHCSVGKSGGFVKRLHEGTYLAHIFEHVLLELQNLCGDKVSYGKARMTDNPLVYNVIVAYRTETIARRCAFLTERLLNSLLTEEDTLIDIHAELEELKALHDDLQLGPSGMAIYRAAKSRGIPITRFGDDDLLLLGHGCYLQKVWATITGKTNLLAADLVGNKYLTTKFLAEYGVLVPRNSIAESAEEAVQIYHAMGEGAVVLKPLDGSHGRGVSVNLQDEVSVRKAFALAQQYSERVLVEEYITGRQYRLCLVNYKLVAAAERIPAYVIGDGTHTVAELVALVNRNPLRGAGHNKPLTEIQIDDAARTLLAKQNLSPEIVPEVKRIVQIQATANLSTGGTAVDVTPIVHEDIVRLAERIARTVELDIAGIDLITQDITKPLVRGSGAVIEVNAAPGIRMHHHPSAGQARDVGGEIVDYLFPYGNKGRIPIVAITGTNGKTTVSRMLNAIFQQAGYQVGMATTEGIFYNNQCQQRGDCSGPISAQIVLHDKRVEAAILETARGGIVRAGLGFDCCDIGIVTNISEDHFGQDGIESLEDLFFIKSLVLEMTAVDGAAIINADDAFATKFAARVQSEIVYFSLQENNVVVRRHLGVGGRAVFVKQNKIYTARGDFSEMVLAVKDIPVTLSGAARHNVQNAVIAIAAAIGYGLDLPSIRKALRSFATNRGRLSIFQVEDFKVCVDYGHNLAGYQAMIHTAKQLPAKRVVGVIGAPGDRRDDVIVRIGKMAGEGFDMLYIKEDEDLRGRDTGETARLLQEGVIASGFDKEKISVILPEYDAVKSALQNAQTEDFIIIFYENYELVTEAIQAFIVQARLKGKGKQLSDTYIPVPLQEKNITKNSFL